MSKIEVQHIPRCCEVNEFVVCRIEDTWREWQRWEEERSKFADWLSDCQRKVKVAKCDGVSFVVLRHEQQNFDVFTSHVQNSLSQLEALNRFYRKLTRDARTDTSDVIKKQAEVINREWDELLQRCTAVSRRMRHLLSVKDDFDATRSALVMWMGDVSTRLRSVERLCDGSTALRLQSVRTIGDEIASNAHRLECVERAGKYLLSKCEANDVTQIENDLMQFRDTHEQVLDQIRYLQCSTGVTQTPHHPSARYSAYNEDGTDIDFDARALDGCADTASMSSDEDFRSLLVETVKSDAAVTSKEQRLARLETLLMQLEPSLDRAQRALREAEQHPHSTDHVTSCAQAVRNLQKLEVSLQSLTGVTNSDPNIALLVRRWKQLQTVVRHQSQQLKQPPLTSEPCTSQMQTAMRSLSGWLDEAESVQTRQTQLPDSLPQLQATVLAHTVEKRAFIFYVSIIPF